MTSMPPEFDPETATPVTLRTMRRVFPDLDQLIDASAEKNGRCDSYRCTRVPNTPVYIVFGINEAEHTVVLVAIRTHEADRGHRN